jgi:putative hemolysin
VLELGRSCVLPAYRTRPVLQKLWQGIAQYVTQHRIDLMFGCGSLYGTSPADIAAELSYLYHYHLADPSVRPVAQPHRYVDMNLIPKDEIDVKTTFMKLPPLIKGYLRIGATIGDGAVIDSQWNSIDVCIVMPTSLVTEKYMKHYQRGNNALAELEKDLADQANHTGTPSSMDKKKAL